MPEHSTLDGDIELSLRRIESRRKQLARFRPYTELGDLDLIEQVSDLDAFCQTITAILKTPLPPGPDITGREGEVISQKYPILELQRYGKACTGSAVVTLKR